MDEDRVREIIREMTFWSGKKEMAVDEIAMIQPGLGRLMPEIGARTWKLYYAAKEGNWPNAMYQFKECRKLFETGAYTRPKHEDAIEEYLRDSWNPLEEIIKSESWGQFQVAFRKAVDDGNAWHEKKDKPYIRWVLPDTPPPDIDFKPRR